LTFGSPNTRRPTANCPRYCNMYFFFCTSYNKSRSLDAETHCHGRLISCAACKQKETAFAPYSHLSPIPSPQWPPCAPKEQPENRTASVVLDTGTPGPKFKFPVTPSATCTAGKRRRPMAPRQGAWCSQHPHPKTEARTRSGWRWWCRRRSAQQQTCSLQLAL
jgi:hypothetical protein